jgi:hypothetical protein
MNRQKKALLIAPLISLPMYTIWFGLMEPKDFFMAVKKMFIMGFFILPIAYATTLCLGLPTYLLLRHLKMNNRLLVTFIGFPLCFLVIFLISFLPFGEWKFRFENLGLAAMCGMSVSGLSMLILGDEA